MPLGKLRYTKKQLSTVCGNRWRKSDRIYRFWKRFYELADMPEVLQSKIDRVLDNSWQDDINVATRGSPEEH